MPPAIHSTITASAVVFFGAWAEARSTGSVPASAASVAAAVAPMKPRR